MGDKALDRAFNRVLAQQRDAEEKTEAQRPLSKEELEAKEAEKLRTVDTPMAMTDAIRRMLLAEKDKDHFRLLELPAPGVDALGRPTWPCTNTDVGKAYRRLSALVHPDKNRSPDARQAFEALNRAHRLLRDPAKLQAEASAVLLQQSYDWRCDDPEASAETTRAVQEEALNSELEAAKRRRDVAEAAATPDERAALFAAKRHEAQQLRRQEAEKYKAEVLQQRQRLQERAKRKREMQERANRREESEESVEDTPVYAQRGAAEAKLPAAKRKGKPKLIF